MKYFFEKDWYHFFKNPGLKDSEEVAPSGGEVTHLHFVSQSRMVQGYFVLLPS